MQHKKILFMISLPEEDILENKVLIQDCISRLKDRGVDIQDVICRESLSRIIDYDIVIIVTHFDKDSGNLLLKDEKLHINDFVNCLPESFSGYLDLSFCHSGIVKSEVENHCPNCITQVSNSLEGTRLYVHLVAYPFVVDKIIENEGIDFHRAYMETLEELFDAAANNPENDTYNDDSLRLGQKKTSIYAPHEVTNKSLLPIYVYIHYDSEREEVKNIAKGHYRKASIHINSNELGGVKFGDTLWLHLSFIEGYDTQFLKVEGENPQKIIVADSISESQFIIKIGDEFNSTNFGCHIDVLKDDKLIKKFTLLFDVVINDGIFLKEDLNNNEAEATDNEELVNQLMPFFTLNEKITTPVRNKRILLFIESLSDMKRVNAKAKPITSYVVDCIKKGWIAPHVESEKGKLWYILKNADLYNASKSYWNLELKDAFR